MRVKVYDNMNAVFVQIALLRRVCFIRAREQLEWLACSRNQSNAMHAGGDSSAQL
jgi:hypothetical protein